MAGLEAYIVQESLYSVPTTVGKIQTFLNGKEIQIFAVIDHSGEAKKAHLVLEDEQLLVFGDPKVGTYLMQENPAIGLDLPLKILVWKDAKGLTQVAYLNPLVFKERYHIEKNSSILDKMAQSLDHLVQTVTQPPK